MIIKCKICQGSGRIHSQRDFFTSRVSVCPACSGAGEFDLATPRERLTECKFCRGRGIIQTSDSLYLSTRRKVCPACKGIGLIERPVIGTTQMGNNDVSVPQSPRLSHYEFDIAVSYASEDREIVQKYTDGLSEKRLKVFYDKYDQDELWGANLYDKFDEVYRTKALFCVIFISRHYASKVWTNHERKSAQARALQENREYVLPVRLDDTEITGIPQTIGYVDLRKISAAELVEMTLKKVKKLKAKHSSA